MWVFVEVFDKVVFYNDVDIDYYWDCEKDGQRDCLIDDCIFCCDFEDVVNIGYFDF